MATREELEIRAQMLKALPRETDEHIRRNIEAHGEWFSVSWAGSTLQELGLDCHIRSKWGQCPECDTNIADMELHDRDMHVIRQGVLLIACEGYYMPAFLTAFRLYLDKFPQED